MRMHGWQNAKNRHANDWTAWGGGPAAGVDASSSRGCPSVPSRFGKGYGWAEIAFCCKCLFRNWLWVLSPARRVQVPRIYKAPKKL